MEGPHLRLRDGLRVEEVGDEAVVFDAASGATVHRVTGPGVEALRLVAAGAVGDLPEHLGPAVEGLVAAGIVTGPGLWSRRRLLTTGAKGALVGGAVWGAATITTFALADPAAAATACSGVTPTNPQQQKYTSNATFVTDNGVTSLKVRCWGAGGGAGGGRYDGTWSAGSGGGGGAYAYTAALTVSPCTAYSVVVGAGGAGGPKRTDGNPGGDSYFGSASTVMAKGGGKGLGANGGNPNGGTGGQASASVGATTKHSGGNGGKGGDDALNNDGGGGGGGASDGGNGGNGGDWNEIGGAGGAAGGAQAGGDGGSAPGNPGSGNWHGEAPGGGGCGGYGVMGSWFSDASTSGGNGARGEVWVGY